MRTKSLKTRAQDPNGRFVDDTLVDLRPLLFIPYWTSPLVPGGPVDTGAVRPVPPGVISYLCQGIQAGSYVPRQPLDIVVQVGNRGPGNASSLATVLVYWSEPIVGGLSAPVLFGFQSVPVPPRGGMISTNVMTATIPTSSPHVCIFALVIHDLDRPVPDPVTKKIKIDPVNDRHWAQHNLQFVSVSPGKIIHFSFTAANPMMEKGAFEVIARPHGERDMETLALRLKATPRLQAESLKMQLLDTRGTPLSEPGLTASLRLDLGELGRRGLHLTLQMGGMLEPHEFAAVEVVLNHVSGKQTQLVGSLGIVLRPEALELT